MRAKRKRILGLLVRLAVIAGVAVGIGFLLRGLEVAALGEAFKDAKLWPLAVGAALSFLNLWCKAVSWRIMLAPRWVVPMRRLYRYTIAAFAASAIAPARAGELLRVWVLKRRDGVPPAVSAAVAIAEKLLDGVAMLILVAPLPWLMPGLPAWVGRSLLLVSGGSIVLLVLLRVLLQRPDAERHGWLGRVKAGMEVLRDPARLAAALGILLLSWLADVAEVTLVLYAVGIHAPITSPLLILFTLNLAILVPSTPAQVGALEFGALVALVDILHVPKAPAVAFAMLYHAMQIVPLILVALALEFRLVLGKAEAEPCPSPEL